MPELPEVETIRRGLAERIMGDRIVSVWLSNQPQTFKSPPRRIAATLEGARIGDVRRMGKHIVIDLNKQIIGGLKPARDERRGRRGGTTKVVPLPGTAQDDKIQTPTLRCAQDGAPGGTTPGTTEVVPLPRTAQLIVHLGMTGSLQVQPPDANVLKHTHMILQLASGRELRFVDARRFGRVWVERGGFETHGTEPLDIGFELFKGLFRGRKTPIKSALLNQKLLRGLGNIYADESLFRAGIRPRRRAATLTVGDLRRLYDSIQQVLTEAIAAGGSSISDYFNAEGEPGLFQTQHRVYGRTGEPCVSCGAPIQRIVVAGRGTHYCARCQK